MKKFVLVILFILIFAVMPNIAYANSNKADVTLILFDISSSMTTEGSYSDGNLSRFQVALRILNELMKSYNASDKVGLRTIGRPASEVIRNVSNLNSNPSIDFNSFGNMFRIACSQSKLVIPIDQNAIYDINNFIYSIKPDGSSTPIEYSLKMAIESDFADYPMTSTKHIIIITDGQESCGGNPCGYIGNIARMRNDIVIDVISVLPDDSNFTLYDCISKPTGGDVYNPNTLNNFNPNIDLKSISPSFKQPTNSYYKPNSMNSRDVKYRTFLLEFR